MSNLPDAIEAGGSEDKADKDIAKEKLTGKGVSSVAPDCTEAQRRYISVSRVNDDIFDILDLPVVELQLPP